MNHVVQMAGSVKGNIVNQIVHTTASCPGNRLLLCRTDDFFL